MAFCSSTIPWHYSQIVGTSSSWSHNRLFKNNLRLIILLRRWSKLHSGTSWRRWLCQLGSVRRLGRRCRTIVHRLTLSSWISTWGYCTYGLASCLSDSFSKGIVLHINFHIIPVGSYYLYSCSTCNWLFLYRFRAELCDNGLYSSS